MLQICQDDIHKGKIRSDRIKNEEFRKGIVEDTQKEKLQKARLGETVLCT